MKTSDENKIKEIIKRQMIELLEKGATLDQVKESIFTAWNKEAPEVLASFLG